MLKRLTIKRFKSIYNETLDLGLVNLFIGPNGSGKSNFLEALGVLAAALSRGIDPISLDSRGVRLSQPRLFKSAFKGQDLPKTFRLEAQFEHGRYECSIRAGVSSPYLEFFSEALYDGNQLVFGRGLHGAKVHKYAGSLSYVDLSAIESNRSVWDLVSALCDVSEELRAELDQFSSFAIYSPQTAVMRGAAVDQRAIEPLGLTGAGLAQAFDAVLVAQRDTTNVEYRAYLQNIINVIWEPGWANQVQIGPFDSEIVPSRVHSEGRMLYIRDKYMKSGRNLLSPYDASEGTLYLIFVAALLAHPTAPKSFALDNVDGTLNPELVRRLADRIVDICAGKGSVSNVEGHIPHQVFMTSHHPSALDSIDLYQETQALFTVSRAGPEDVAVGSTKLRRILPPPGVSKDEWAVLKGGKNLSQLLLEGRIPNALGAQ